MKLSLFNTAFVVFGGLAAQSALAGVCEDHEQTARFLDGKNAPVAFGGEHSVGMFDPIQVFCQSPVINAQMRTLERAEFTTDTDATEIVPKFDNCGEVPFNCRTIVQVRMKYNKGEDVEKIVSGHFYMYYYANGMVTTQFGADPLDRTGLGKTMRLQPASSDLLTYTLAQSGVPAIVGANGAKHFWAARVSCTKPADEQTKAASECSLQFQDKNVKLSEKTSTGIEKLLKTVGASEEGEHDGENTGADLLHCVRPAQHWMSSSCTILTELTK